SQKGEGEERDRERNPQNRRKKFESVLNFGDAPLTASMKGRGCDNKNRCVDEKREHERDAGIDGGEFDRFSFAVRGLLVIPRLYDRGMKIKVMRHHGCAENSNRDVKHVAIADDFRVRNKTAQHGLKLR